MNEQRMNNDFKYGCSIFKQNILTFGTVAKQSHSVSFYID